MRYQKRDQKRDIKLTFLEISGGRMKLWKNRRQLLRKCECVNFLITWRKILVTQKRTNIEAK